MIRDVLRRMVGRHARLPKPLEQRSESDVARDDTVADSRAHGGQPGKTDMDAATTTGTGANEAFVGRAAGQDPGDAGVSGAEARAADERDDGPRRQA